MPFTSFAGLLLAVSRNLDTCGVTFTDAISSILLCCSVIPVLLFLSLSLCPLSVSFQFIYLYV